MHRTRALAAAAISVVLAVLPVGLAPAQAATALVGNCGSASTLTANCANLPILVEAGIVSAGGTTAATGATAAVVGTGSAGTLGFGTVVGATGVAVAMGLLSLNGVEPGMYVETDPDFSGGSGCITATSYPTIGSVVPDSTCAPMDIRYGSSAKGTLKLGTPSGRTVPYEAVWDTATWPRVSMGVTCYVGNATSKAIANYGTGTSWNGNDGPYTPSGPENLVCGSPLPGGGVFLGMLLSVVYNSTTTYYWLVAGNGAPQPGYHGTIRTRVECIAPGWGDQPSYETATARVDVAAGERLPIPSVKCTAPGVARSAVVEYQADGSTSWVTIGEGDATATVTPLVDDYPNCLSPSGASLCELQLQRLEGTTWTSCGPLAMYCPTWVEEWSETPDTYRCRFGGYAVDIDLCSAFRQPGILLPNTHLEAGQDPEAVTPTDPAPDPLPNPGTNPDTGDALETPPWVDTSGNADPGTNGASCFPSGWGVLNPVSWVLMPVQCALKWAFIPRASVVEAKLEDIKLRAQGGWLAAPVALVTSVVGAVNIAASGCEGPPLRLYIDLGHGPVVDETYYPMNACEEPMAGVASAVSGMIGFGVILGMGLAFVRYVMTLIGYAPFGADPGTERSSVRFRADD